MTEVSSGEWHLKTKRATRIMAGVVGGLFLLLAMSLGVSVPFGICLLLGITLVGAGLFSEEIKLSNRGLDYHRPFPFRVHRKFSSDILINISHGPVTLRIGKRTYPGYRVWLEFQNAELPRAVIYEVRLKSVPDAFQKGENLAQRLAQSLGRQAQRIDI